MEQNPIVEGTRRPDLRVEGEIFDVYSPNYGTSAWNKFIGAKDKVLNGQPTRVVINLKDSGISVPRRELEFAQRRAEAHTLDEVLVIKRGQVKRISVKVRQTMTIELKIKGRFEITDEFRRNT